MTKPTLQGRFSRNTYWLDAVCKSFHDSHIVKALQVFLHSIWIKMFWIERCVSATDQGKFQRWQVKALISTRQIAR
ncbi:hypothetical protein FP742_24585 [Vibrio parahaemolyticus]|nr:hypothetical protein [Vibrio parahaemolyticus]NCN64161.1 hypothetical protein [Vibrio parahaemolyticus]